MTSILTTTPSTLEKDHDDKSSWIPLEQPEEPSDPPKTRATYIPKEHKTKEEVKENLNSVYMQTMKKDDGGGLIDKPIRMLGVKFVYYFCMGFWNQDIRIRIGLPLIGLGISFYLISITKLFLPILLFFIVTIILLFRTLPHHQLESSFSPIHLRKLILFLVCLPTLLQIFILLFFSHIINKTNSPTLTITLFFIISTHFIVLFKLSTNLPLISIQLRLNLYILTFLTSCYYNFHITTHVLGAPLCFLLGGFCLVSSKIDLEWMNVSSRLALRYALTDVICHLSRDVRVDELLQLVLWRWIVDYWASEESVGGVVEWEDMEGMLNVTVERMEVESGGDCTTGTTATSTRTSQSQDHGVDSSPQSQPPSNQAEDPTPSNQPETSTSSQTSNPFLQLKTLLINLNTDTNARPAIESYQQTIESIPPSLPTALFSSLFRKTPFLLSFLLSANPILLPLAVLNCMELQSWDYQTKDEDDPMQFLLEGNILLLKVWENLLHSVVLLKRGLNTARQVETTALAVDFAGQLGSLGVDVYTYGWVHLITELLGDKYREKLERMVESCEKIHTNWERMEETKNLVEIGWILMGKGWIWGLGCDDGEERQDDEVRDDSMEEVDLTEEELDLSTEEFKRVERSCTNNNPDVDVTTETEKATESRDASFISLSSTQQQDNQSIKEQTKHMNNEEKGVYQLMSIVTQQHLISEKEKRDLEEKIKTDKSVAEAIRKSLVCLLAAAEIENLMEEPDGMVESLEHMKHTPDVECKEKVHMDRDRDDSARNGEEEERNAGARNEENDVQKNVVVVDDDDDDDDDSWEKMPSENDDGIYITPDNTTTTLQTEQNNNEHWIKWLSGGLAVIGAAAGCAVMSQTNQDQRRVPPSTVVIEEISDEEEEKED